MIFQIALWGIVLAVNSACENAQQDGQLNKGRGSFASIEQQINPLTSGKEIDKPEQQNVEAISNYLSDSLDENKSAKAQSLSTDNLAAASNQMEEAAISIESESTHELNEEGSLSASTLKINFVDNSEATHTVSAIVELTLTAQKATEMYITNSADCQDGGSWEPFAVTRSWTLAQTNATATVYAKFRYSILQESDCLSDTIIHDDQAPNANMTINSGGGYTSSRQVTINFSANDATEMYITNTADCATDGSWEAFSASKSAWLLAQADAANIVYAKLRDAAGNSSSCLSASITHDATSPTAPSSLDDGASSPPNQLNLSWTAGSDGLSGLAGYQVAIGSSAGDHDVVPWTNVGNVISYTLRDLDLTIGTSYYASIRGIDNAGNTSNIRAGDGFTVISEITAIAAINSHSCALFNSGKIKCWGANTNGQLGQENTTSYGGIGVSLASMPAIDLGTGRSPIKVDGGEYQSCAILDNNTLKCWGYNSYGQLGYENNLHLGDNLGEMGDSLATVNLGANRTVIDIALGSSTCALLDNGSVKCWGYNAYGQLGRDNSSTVGNAANQMGDNLAAINLGAGRTATQISGGKYFNCALLDNGGVKCWGQNGSGQLGQDSATQLGDGTGEMAALTAINLGANATKVAAGISHSCAILSGGSVKCWGSNSYGQLGQDTASSLGDGAGEMAALATVNLGSNRTATQLALGDGHTCALLDNGSVKCWGRNNYGQLGQGSTDSLGDQAGEMAALAAINLGSGRTALEISVDQYHSCARLDTNQVKCWGRNDKGQLGQYHSASLGDEANEMGDYLPAISLGSGRTAIALGTGLSHSCAILDNQSLKCWGDGSYGRLGQGTTASIGLGLPLSSLSAIELGSGRTATAISGGTGYTCALLDNMQLACWGTSSSGRLGYTPESSAGSNIGDQSGEMGDHLTMLSLEADVVELVGGNDHVCARLSNNKIKCWGLNTYGQLGQDNTTAVGLDENETLNLPTIELGTNRTALQIAAGAAHSCALLDNNSVKCWGRNQYGQLGLDNTSQLGDGPGEMAALTAVNLGTSRTATQVAAGAYHSCALLDDSNVKCWGYNSYGQLGQNSVSHRGDGAGEMAALAAISLGANATQIAAGMYFTCALLVGGSVKCWGKNIYGQLGQGSTSSLGDGASEMENLQAIDLGTNRSALSIKVGNEHVCALLDNKSIKCWGLGTYGQLGQNAQDNLGDAAGEMGDNLPAIQLTP